VRKRRLLTRMRMAIRIVLTSNRSTSVRRVRSSVPSSIVRHSGTMAREAHSDRGRMVTTLHRRDERLMARMLPHRADRQMESTRPHGDQQTTDMPRPHADRPLATTPGETPRLPTGAMTPPSDVAVSMRHHHDGALRARIRATAWSSDRSLLSGEQDEATSFPPVLAAPFQCIFHPSRSVRDDTQRSMST